MPVEYVQNVEQHDYVPSPSRIFMIGFIAAFRGLRMAIGYMCLIGILVGAVIFTMGFATWDRSMPGVNLHPNCYRKGFADSAAHYPDNVFPGVQQFGASRDQNVFAPEASGTGYCQILAKRNDPNLIRQRLAYYWEVPVENPKHVQSLFITNKDEPNPKMIIGFLTGLFFLVILFTIWLPATLVAMFSRKVAQNASEYF